MNMKKAKIVMLAFICSFALLLPVLLNVSANTQSAGAAGSIDDPLVTAGYVAKYVTEILEAQEQKINSSMQSMIQEAVDKAMQNTPLSENIVSEAIPSETISSETAEYSEGFAVSGSYELLTLNQNEKIRAKSGTLEVILRPGAEAKVISEHQDLGLADITAGQEIFHAEIAPINHTLLIPRADGRGLFITSDIAYIFARGDYEIYE